MAPLLASSRLTHPTEGHSVCPARNLNQPVESLVANMATDLFQPLPKECDLALTDQLHFYLPGRDVPKNSTNILTKHYGFVTD